MRIFGLLGLLVTIALAAWWLTSMGPVAPSEEGRSASSTYGGAIDAAKGAAGKLGSTVTLSIGSVEVYDGIYVPLDATELDVSDRELTGQLSDKVRFLADLTVVDISGNQFRQIPAEIGRLSRVETLNLANNPLTDVPHEIGDLQRLRVLDVRGTEISDSDLEVIRQRLPDSTTILAD